MIPYILHVGCILAGCLLFYKLLLEKETFYKVNRIVLLSCLVLSFALPLLPVPQQWSFRKAERAILINTTQPSFYSNSSVPKVQQDIPTITTEPTINQVAISSSKVITWIVYLYWFGVVIFGFNFLLQAIILLYRAYSNPVIKDGRFRIVEVNGNKAPCSFANNIFINPETYDWETYNQILLHEKVHVSQGHSFDILLTELVLIFQWFNPFAWLYRKELEKNLEFETDDRLLEHSGVEKESYQMNLLKVSAPHFPLSLTTNYNQSLLKKRLVMMNVKKSNVHSTWKYLFLFPVLLLFVCLLNEPAAISQPVDGADKNNKDVVRSANTFRLQTEGSWFAVIKDEKVTIQFKSDDDQNSFNSSSFLVSEFSSIPREGQGTFKLTRDAGTMVFTGKFEGTKGMGRYQFTPAKEYSAYLQEQGITGVKENDMLTFFFIDIKKSYIQMLKDNGYSRISKDQLIPVAALKIDAPFIRYWKGAGYKDISLQDLIPLKSLGIDGAYVNDIHRAGYTHVTTSQLISMKSQGIDGAYIKSVKRSQPKEGNKAEDIAGAEELIAFKSQNIDSEYINSFRKVGYEAIPHEKLIAMKSLDITPAFIKSFQAAGYKDVSISDLIALKSQNITPAFIKGFTDLGYKDVDLDDVIALKSTGVTPDYVTSMKGKGFDYKNLSKYIQLKSIN